MHRCDAGIGAGWTLGHGWNTGPPPPTSPLRYAPRLSTLHQTEDDGVRYSEGQRVEARYRGGEKYFQGTIRRENRGGVSYDIEYDVGGWEVGHSPSDRS